MVKIYNLLCVNLCARNGNGNLTKGEERARRSALVRISESIAVLGISYGTCLGNRRSDIWKVEWQLTNSWLSDRAPDQHIVLSWAR